MKERKQVFVERVNSLNTKAPYSYAFRKETAHSSLLNIVTYDHNHTISTHFQRMFNTSQPITKTPPSITVNPKVKNWNFELITTKSLQHTIRSLKNTMPGFDNISVPLPKTLNKTSLNFIKDAINLAITTQHIPSELLCIGLLLPLPKVGSPNNITQTDCSIVIKVLVNGHLTTPFNASVGVPQGDPCSPALFNLYINSVTNICSKFAGINIYNHQLHMLLYADDILVVANTKQDMQKAINALKGELSKIGLVLAPTKCKMLAFTGKTVLSNKAHITIDDHTIQSDNSLEYLGSTCTLDKSKIKWSAPGVTDKLSK